MHQILGINYWKWVKKWKTEAQERIFPGHQFLPVAMTKPIVSQLEKSHFYLVNKCHLSFSWLKNAIFIWLVGQFFYKVQHFSGSWGSSIPPGIPCSKFHSAAEQEELQLHREQQGCTEGIPRALQLPAEMGGIKVCPTGRKNWICCVSLGSCGNLWLEFSVPAPSQNQSCLNCQPTQLFNK